MKKTIKKLALILAILAVTISATACQSDDNADGDSVTIKVGVVGEYNAQWDTVNELLSDQGITVELVKFSDYSAPNRALNDGEIDLNAFQHKEFLENDSTANEYDLSIIGDTIIAPLAIFHNKDKISSVEDIKDGDIIAIPGDLTNGGRALKLLESAGLIVCDPDKGILPTKADITEYLVDIEIREAESATLASILPDCAAAVINGGNAYTAGLSPSEDTIFIESVGAVPKYINIIVSRTDDADRAEYAAILEAYQSDEVKETLQAEYEGAFLPAW